jgi:BirA family biotin operon repressor/biotin-[acetyl-CoA-carboxylase] ligase
MNVKAAVLQKIAESGENYVSGSHLANEIGVSRNAVWKAVKSLEAEGFVFDAASNRGYRISTENNKLAKELICAGLNGSERNIIVFDEIDSTNNYAKDIASTGAKDGTVIVSDKQVSGKGRMGRSFSSPSGTGLYMSVIIRPEISLEASQLITSCAAVAVADAAEKLCGREVDIKWVNDLYMNGRKFCGILTEASLSLETKSLDYAVIGIGINVRSVKDVFDAQLGSIATSIEDETGKRISRNTLCSEIITMLEKRLADIESRSYLEDYRRRELLTGNIITANSGGKPISGKAVGIDNNANLIIELPDGTTSALGSGEANLCRIKKQ